MSGLQARMRNDGEILIVQFAGRIDVESAPPLRRACRQQLRSRKVVFDFGDLNFVGSAGILPFLEALQDFAVENPGQIKFANVGQEFRRVLMATTLAAIETWDQEAQAVDAFKRPASMAEVRGPAQVAFGASDGQIQAAEPAPLLALRYDTDNRD